MPKLKNLAALAFLAASAAVSAAQARPGEVKISADRVSIRVLVQGPAATDTEMQIICLFRSDPSNGLHGSLIELNEKLGGLLDQIRKPTLFGGELGETLLIAPAGKLGARRLLLIGLGDSATFAPEQMEFVGSIAYREANRLGVAHPFFAPTVLDGGVSKFETGQISERVVAGFLRAARAEAVLVTAGSSGGQAVQDLTFLAGEQHASSTQQGIKAAVAADAAQR